MMQKIPKKLFEDSSHGESLPVLMTGNSIITHQIPKLILETTNIKAFVVPSETVGCTVDNAVHEGTFTPMAVMKALTGSGLAAKNGHKRMIGPGPCQELKNSIEAVTHWSMIVGANQLILITLCSLPKLIGDLQFF